MKEKELNIWMPEKMLSLEFLIRNPDKKGDKKWKYLSDTKWRENGRAPVETGVFD